MRYCNKINYRFDILSSKRCPVNIDFWCIIMKESHNRCTVPLSPILIMLNGWRPALYISITPIKESLSSLLSAGFSNCRVISIKTATDLVSCCPITTVNNHHGETIYVKLWKWTNLINERSLTTSLFAIYLLFYLQKNWWIDVTHFLLGRMIWFSLARKTLQKSIASSVVTIRLSSIEFKCWHQPNRASNSWRRKITKNKRIGPADSYSLFVSIVCHVWNKISQTFR